MACARSSSWTTPDASSASSTKPRSRARTTRTPPAGGRSFVRLGEPRAKRHDVFFFEVLVVEQGIVAGGAVAVRVAQALGGLTEDAAGHAAPVGGEPSGGAERAIERQFDPTGMNERAGRATHAAKSRFCQRHVAAAPVQV